MKWSGACQLRYHLELDMLAASSATIATLQSSASGLGPDNVIGAKGLQWLCFPATSFCYQTATWSDQCPSGAVASCTAEHSGLVHWQHQQLMLEQLLEIDSMLSSQEGVKVGCPMKVLGPAHACNRQVGTKRYSRCCCMPCPEQCSS